MADFNWPDALPPQTMVWTMQKAGVQFRSPFAGSVDSVTFPGWFWKVSLTLKPQRSKSAGAAQARAFFNRMAGGENTVTIYNWLQQVPRGTMRGSPTVSADAARGATQVLIATTGTLISGDLFKIGNFVYECAADCSPAAGVLTVPLSARLRIAVAASAPVAWDRPTVKCTMPSMSNSAAYRPGIMEGLPIDLEEA